VEEGEMRSKHFLLLILAMLVSAANFSGSVVAQSLVRLGEARIDLASGRAIISLSGAGSVDRIRLVSVDHSVHVTAASVTFADGRSQALGGMTLVPGVRSGERSVGVGGTPTRLTLVFRPQAGAPTTIVVFGRPAVERPAAPPATAEAPGNGRKAYRTTRRAPPAAEPQTDEAAASRGRDAARQQERPPQEEAKKQDEPRPADRSRSATVPTPAPAAPRSMTERPAPTPPPLESLPTPIVIPPPPGPRAANGSGTARSMPPAAVGADVCKARSICTPVPVFFGTDRKQTPHPDRIAFGADRERRLQLGQATVTVPRVKRQAGKVLRPTLYEKLILRIPEEGDPARHFTIPKNGVTVMSEDEFIAAARANRDSAGMFKDHAFVFVHGYNTAFESALYRTAQIAFDLSDIAGSEADRVPFGTAFLYSWPSGGGTVDYVYDHESARGAEQHFREFLDIVIAKSGAKQIHLIAHSLGNAVLLNVLQDYKMPQPSGASINQIILAAPAIDAEEFGIIAGKVKGLATGGITLYASSNDRAISAASSLNRGRPMAGGVPAGGPVIVAGVDSIDVSAIPTDSFWGHDRYADRRELLEDIWRLVSTGLRPPESRNQHYKVLGKVGAEFWRYTP
jgi:esterase/lipase superfamily enzyme